MQLLEWNSEDYSIALIFLKYTLDRDEELVFYIVHKKKFVNIPSRILILLRKEDLYPFLQELSSLLDPLLFFLEESPIS